METSSVLRIATFNIRYDNRADGVNSWRHRQDAVRQCIDELHCDVLGLQEVLPRQRRYLSRRLPALRWYGVGREDGRRRGEQSPVLLRPASMIVHEWHTAWLSSTPDIAGSTGIDTRIPRIATIVRARFAGREIGVINTHLDHKSHPARRHAAEQIARIVTAEQRAWIVCGDFNCTLKDPAVRPLLDAGLHSALDDRAPGTFHAFTGSTDGRRIDHVLVGEPWAVVSAQVDTARPGGIVPSDHWPVVAELMLGVR